MKKEISPTTAIAIVVVILVLIGGYWFYSNSGGGPKALAAGAPSKNVGGRRLPTPVGGSGGSEVTR